MRRNAKRVRRVGWLVLLVGAAAVAASGGGGMEPVTSATVRG